MITIGLLRFRNLGGTSTLFFWMFLPVLVNGTEKNQLSKIMFLWVFLDRLLVFCCYSPNIWNFIYHTKSLRTEFSNWFICNINSEWEVLSKAHQWRMIYNYTSQRATKLSLTFLWRRVVLSSPRKTLAKNYNMLHCWSVNSVSKSRRAQVFLAYMNVIID